MYFRDDLEIEVFAGLNYSVVKGQQAEERLYS
jgi:hypothetical protein